MTEREQYDNLLGHLWHHDVRGWLLAGAREEDARTIKEAVKRVSSTRLREALAQALTSDSEGVGDTPLHPAKRHRPDRGP
jgi:hypothetical protein